MKNDKYRFDSLVKDCLEQLRHNKIVTMEIAGNAVVVKHVFDQISILVNGRVELIVGVPFDVLRALRDFDFMSELQPWDVRIDGKTVDASVAFDALVSLPNHPHYARETYPAWDFEQSLLYKRLLSLKTSQKMMRTTRAGGNVTIHMGKKNIYLESSAGLVIYASKCEIKDNYERQLKALTGIFYEIPVSQRLGAPDWLESYVLQYEAKCWMKDENDRKQWFDLYDERTRAIVCRAMKIQENPFISLVTGQHDEKGGKTR